MGYNLKWTNPAIDKGNKRAIEVGVARVVNDEASVTFTGKGASNYGTVQQENIMHILENFANFTPPLRATVGQAWYQYNDEKLDGVRGRIQICTGAGAGRTNAIWHGIGWSDLTHSLTVPPLYPNVGDEWVVKAGTATTFIYRFTGLGRHPVKNGTIGGWEQVFPAVDIIAGRDEYDEMLGLVNQLIGNINTGGNGLLSRSEANLTDLAKLDTSLIAKFNALGKDENVVTPASDAQHLKVDVTSQDWDNLLAVAKLAVSRLSVASSAEGCISDLPFVYDGHKVDAALLALPTTDKRYPSLDRRMNKKRGSLALGQLYTSTYNTLMFAVANRYAIRGIDGSPLGNPAARRAQAMIFGPTVVQTRLFTLSGAANNSDVDTTFKLRFGTKDNYTRWLNSGGFIEVVTGYDGTNQPLKTLIENSGVVRVTKDASRLLGNTVPLAVTHYFQGGLDLAAAKPGTVVELFSNNGLTLSAKLISSSTECSVEFTYAIANIGASDGTIHITSNSVSDELLYDTDKLVFGKPADFVLATDLTSKPTFMTAS